MAYEFYNLFREGALDAASFFIMLVAYVFALVWALSIHECGHALAAWKNGDLTAKLAGRVTLNPLKHLDVMGCLALLFIGFGWAKPVPVNPANFEHQKKGIFTVSVAGVAMNLIMVAVSFGFIALLVFIGRTAGISNEGVGYVLYTLFYLFFTYSVLINATLFVFNLIPLFPLDGLHVIEAFIRPVGSYEEDIPNRAAVETLVPQSGGSPAKVKRKKPIKRTLNKWFNKYVHWNYRAKLWNISNGQLVLLLLLIVGSFFAWSPINLLVGSMQGLVTRILIAITGAL